MAGYPSYSVCSPAYKRSSVAPSLPGAKSVSRNNWLDSVRNFNYTESFICHIDEHSSVLFPLAFFTFNTFYFLKVNDPLYWRKKCFLLKKIFSKYLVTVMLGCSLGPTRTFLFSILKAVRVDAAIFRAASLATPLVMVKIVAKIAATIVVESSIGFYFSKGLQ